MTDTGHADVIFSGGTVFTADLSFTAAQAVAVRGGAIAAVGAEGEVRRLAGDSTKMIDLAGRTLLPGLIDSHLHSIGVGGMLGDLDLYRTTSITDIVARLQDWAARVPDGDAVVGRGDCWHPRAFEEGRLPNRRDLDEVATDREVMISDVNKAILNTFALEKTGVTKDTPDPEGGGVIGRDERGEPDGAFFFGAKLLTPLGMQSGLRREAPIEELILRADEVFAGSGLTGVVSAAVHPEGIRAYLDLGRRGGLRCRYTLLPEIKFLDELAEMGISFVMSEGKVRIGSLKIFFDAFLTHKTALMYDHFEGEPENFGKSHIPGDELTAKLKAARGAGWPIGVHVTGDKALDLAIDAFERAYGDNKEFGTQNSLIHAYLPSPEAFERTARLNLGVALQPPFIEAWGEYVRDFLGERRAAPFTPVRTYLDRGIVVGGGSDAPITTYQPFAGIYAAVTRNTEALAVLGPEERVSVADAIRIYTTGAAEIAGEADVRGSIEAGRLADLIVVEGDLSTAPPDGLADTGVVLTMVGGEVVYEKAT